MAPSVVDTRQNRLFPCGMRLLAAVLTILLALAGQQACAGASPPPAEAARQRFITATDGVRLHVRESGPPAAPTIVLVPGWTMPSWIWDAQQRALSRHWRVVAMDPRGQGGSDVPATGYDHIQRARDIGSVIAATGDRPVVIVAWSLAVLETLALIHVQGDRRIAGLVLVDNSVGEDPPPPAPVKPPQGAPPKPPHAEAMRRFVHGMFWTRRDPAWLDRLTQATLRMPEASAKTLLSWPVPRAYWKEALYATTRPVLYVIRPRWEPQAANLARHRAGTEIEIFQNSGHALFVDDPARFNAVVESFVRRRIWP